MINKEELFKIQSGLICELLNAGTKTIGFSGVSLEVQRDNITWENKLKLMKDCGLVIKLKPKIERTKDLVHIHKQSRRSLL